MPHDEKKDSGSSVPTDLSDRDTERVTPSYASGEWLAGYNAGEKRGVSSVIAALRESLAEVGVSENDTEGVIDKVCRRANVIRG